MQAEDVADLVDDEIRQADPVVPHVGLVRHGKRAARLAAAAGRGRGVPQDADTVDCKLGVGAAYHDEDGYHPRAGIGASVGHPVGGPPQKVRL